MGGRSQQYACGPAGGSREQATPPAAPSQKAKVLARCQPNSGRVSGCLAEPRPACYTGSLWPLLWLGLGILYSLHVLEWCGGHTYHSPHPLAGTKAARGAAPANLRQHRGPTVLEEWKSTQPSLVTPHLCPPPMATGPHTNAAGHRGPPRRWNIADHFSAACNRVWSFRAAQLLQPAIGTPRITLVPRANGT